MLHCKCGGTFREQKGFTKKGGKPYHFYGCSGFPNCTTTIQPDQYDAWKSLDQIPSSAGVAQGVAKTWTPKNYSPRNPRQVRNTKGISVPHRRMTDEQERWIDAMLGHKTIVIGECDAGTGKSSTARQLAARTKPQGYETVGIIVAFGKRASMEMAAELPPHWASSTVHSVGYEACAAEYGINDVNEAKTYQILCAEYGKPSSERPKIEGDATTGEGQSQRQLYSIVEKLVQLCKAMALTEHTAPDAVIEQWARKYNVDIGQEPARAYTMTREVLKISRTEQGIHRYGINFDDQPWLPVANNLKVAQYQYVVGDEWQDSSISRMRLAVKMVKSGGTFGFLGDSGQAIFGFTFADTTSMETSAQLAIELLHRTVEKFPMTINWRCPSVPLDLVRLIHPSIQARPNAPRGSVHILEYEDAIYDAARVGDLILCRVNADLIRTAYKFIQRGIPAVVLGRDIAKKLRDIIARFAFDDKKGYVSSHVFINRLNEWYTGTIEEIEKKNLRNTEAALQIVDDDYKSILFLAGVELGPDEVTIIKIGARTVQDILNKLNEMFGEETDKNYNPKRVITLSTVHKMKGGQCARVFILNAAAYHPHPMAASEWEQVQEMCILYVALTRVGDGTNNTDQRLFLMQGMPQVLVELGGMQFVTPYEGEQQ